MAFRCQPTRPSWSHLHEAQGSSIRRREMCDIQHLRVATSAEADQLRAEMSRQHQNWKKISNWKHTLTFIHFPWFLKLQKWLPLIQEPASVLEGSPLSPWEDAIWAVICSWPWNAYLSPRLLTSCGFKWLEEVKPTPKDTMSGVETWLQRCSNPKVLSPPLSPRFRAQGFHFRDPLLLSPAFAATFAVFRRKVLLLIMVVTKTYTCSLSRRLSRLFILKALSRSFRQVFARGVLAYAQHKNINVYLKPLHKGFLMLLKYNKYKCI